MATATAAGARVGQLETREVFPVVTHQSTCSRCGGLMVSDFCMDLLNSTGELEFAAQRCVQCGEVVDPVILRNRRTGQEAKAPSLNRPLSTYASGSGSSCRILTRSSAV